MRMLVMMVISFITTRVMLRALGVDNYGINNVVGGLVSMFSMLSASLSGAVSRFFTFGLGKGDMKHLRVVFSTSINIHIVLAVIVLVAIETVGVWFLNHRAKPSNSWKRLYLERANSQKSLCGTAKGEVCR